MYKNENEKLIDILLGEAVMVLLQDDAIISNAALIKQLQTMAIRETDVVRQRACRRAVSVIRSHLLTDRDGARNDHLHTFNSDGPEDGTRKH